MIRVGLVDGDVVAYSVASSCEIKVDWDNDGKVEQYTKGLDLMMAKVDNVIDGYFTNLNLDKVRVYLSCPSLDNFRLDYLPTYKGNRRGLLKPKLLPMVQQYLRDKYNAQAEPRLEGDDLLGIDATNTEEGVLKIIISIDKDMQTLPVWQNNPDKGKKRLLKQGWKEAFLFHMLQTVLGDTTDGYQGCYGSGAKAWQKILKDADEEASMWANAAQYKAIVWKHVVAEYERKGFTEEEAIVQARVSHILWVDDYNFTTGEVTPWQPPK